MNWVDIAIIFVIAVTSLYSLMWGFVRQLLLMVCFAAGLYVAMTYNGWVYEQFTQSWATSETVAKVIAGGLLFAGTFIAASILTIPLFKLVRSRLIKVLDHFTGLIFGFFLGWVIASVAWIAAVMSLQLTSDDPNVANTRLLPYVHASSLMILSAAEQAPFLQDDDLQLRILEAWEAMRDADPRLSQRGSADLQAGTGGLRSDQSGDAIGTLISNTGN